MSGAGRVRRERGPVGCQVLVDLLARQPGRARAAVLVGPTMDPHPRTAGRQVLRWLRNLRPEDLGQAPVIAPDVLDAGVRGDAGDGRLLA